MKTHTSSGKSSPWFKVATLCGLNAETARLSGSPTCKTCAHQLAELNKPPANPALIDTVCGFVETVANDCGYRYSFTKANGGSVYYRLRQYDGDFSIKVRVADHDRLTWNTDLHPDVDLRPPMTLEEVRAAIAEVLP